MHQPSLFFFLLLSLPASECVARARHTSPLTFICISFSLFSLIAALLSSAGSFLKHSASAKLVTAIELLAGKHSAYIPAAADGIFDGSGKWLRALIGGMALEG